MQFTHRDVFLVPGFPVKEGGHPVEKEQEDTSMDYEKIKEGVRLMLEGIGEDVTREGLLETPDRIAKMCGQIYGGASEKAVPRGQQQHGAGEGYHLLFRL